MSEHTPGPLSVRGSYTGSSHTHVVRQNGDSVAVFHRRADAVLFAEASVLIEALEQIHARTEAFRESGRGMECDSVEVLELIASRALAAHRPAQERVSE